MPRDPILLAAVAVAYVPFVLALTFAVMLGAAGVTVPQVVAVVLQVACP